MNPLSTHLHHASGCRLRPGIPLSTPEVTVWTRAESVVHAPPTDALSENVTLSRIIPTAEESRDGKTES